MKENEIRFKLSAYNWQGKILDSISYTTSESYEVNQKSDDLMDFQLSTLETLQGGEYDFSDN